MLVGDSNLLYWKSGRSYSIGLKSIWGDDAMQNILGLILAGGQGTRLGVLTEKYQNQPHNLVENTG